MPLFFQRRLFFVLICAALSFYASPIAIPIATAADLNERLDALVQSAPAGGFTGIDVVEVATGTVLYHVNEDRLLLPASNLKVLTSALAWERLHPDYRFVTKVLREASGSVVLVGAGDPSMSGRVFPFDKTSHDLPPLQAIDDLADQMIAHGLTSVNGDVIGDDRLYPWEPYPPGWTVDDIASDFGAPVSALALNENVITVSIRPAEHVGDPAILSLTPALEFITIDNQVMTSAAEGRRNSPLRIRAYPGPGSNEWRLVGSIPAGHLMHGETLPVGDPALFSATALYDALVRRGVAITGGPVARHRMQGDPYAPAVGEELASRTSPPLRQLLQTMDKVSVNLYAEIFLREAARAALHEASTEEGVKELAKYLKEVTGEKSGGWRLDDGSGLSRNSLVTPRVMTSVLVHMAASTSRDAWLALFPIGGEDGTLENRLCCMSGGHGIRAKTGSLDRASALSGYADSKSHGLVAFSILVSDYSGSASSVRQWIDKITTALLE